MSSNGVQDPSATEQTSADTPVEQTEVGKGKGKAAAEEPTMDSEEEDEASSGEDEEVLLSYTTATPVPSHCRESG